MLESGFDPAAKEAWVVVGVSDKTIAAAHASHDMMAAPPALPTSDRPAQSRPANAPYVVRRNGSDF